MRFVCALLVVAIHIGPIASFSFFANYWIKNYLARIAVPFYFISSGYFLFRKTDYHRFDFSIPFAYIKKILYLYLIWTAIYLPLTVKFDILKDPEGIFHGILLWIRNCIFTGSYLHLWYLNAAIIAVLIVSVLLSKNISYHSIMAFSVVMYMIGLLPQTYFVFCALLKNTPSLWAALKFIEKFMVTSRNGLFFGFLFVGMGMMFAYKPIYIPIKKAFFNFCFFMILFLFEAIMVRHMGWAREHDMYLFLVPVSYYMFYLTTHIDLKPRKIYATLKHMGVLIFYLHLFVKPFVEYGLTVLHRITNVNFNHSLVFYTGTVCVTAVLSYGIILLSNTSSFGWLKKVYC